MARISPLSLIAAITIYFFAVLPTVFAGPACVHRNRQSNNCVAACATRWGRPGNTSSSHKANSSAPPSPPKTFPKPSPSPSPSSIPKSSPAPAANVANSAAKSDTSADTSGSDIDQYLSAHNSVRAQHGAAALTWNNTLADAAQQWADGCKFVHSGGSLGPYGENLAAGTGSSYDIATAIKSWTDEVSQYDASNPQPSHFTQVVWKATTQVGCALQMCNGIFAASFGEASYYVCEYYPQGNVIGEFAQNVQA